MTFSKRERLLIFGTLAALAALVGDRYLLTPVLAARGAVAEERDRLVVEKAEADSMLARQVLLEQKWETMVKDGLQADPTAAEGQLLRALQDWSYDARLRLSALRPERSMAKAVLPEITVHATGTGSMESVARFLWKLRTAKIPVRVKMVQIGSRKEGTDDLSLQMRISTLYTQVPARGAEPTGGSIARGVN